MWYIYTMEHCYVCEVASVMSNSCLENPMTLPNFPVWLASAFPGRRSSSVLKLIVSPSCFSFVFVLGKAWERWCPWFSWYWGKDVTWPFDVLFSPFSPIRPRRVFESLSWWATIHGVAETEATEQLSTHAFLSVTPLGGERSSEHPLFPPRKEFKTFCLLPKKLIIRVSSDLFTLLFS